MASTTTMYKVVYHPNSGSSSETAVMFKWFKTFDEATDFGSKLGNRVMEIKQYDKPDGYPSADLDMS